MDGHLPSLGWSPTIRTCTTDLEFGTYTFLTKLTPGDNCHGWSTTILRMVVHQPKDGHPPILGWSPTRKKCTTDYILLTNLTPGDNCLGWLPTFTRMDPHQPKNAHPPTSGWSPTRRKFTTYFKFGTYTLLTKIRLGHIPSLCGSPTNLRMVTHQPKYGHRQTKDAHPPE